MPYEVAVRSYDVWFIESDPKAYVFAEAIDDFLGVAFEVIGEVVVCEAALICEPKREGPVPEGDERSDTSFLESNKHGFVVIECFFAKSSFTWLYA